MAAFEIDSGETHLYASFGRADREAGVVSWGLDNKTRCNSFWEAALKYSKYDFEYRLATVRQG